MLQQKAQSQLDELRVARSDPRYQRAIGALVGASVLSTNERYRVPRAAPRLSDALFAGTVEPRVFEVLPAVVIKMPRLFKLPKKLPADLQAVVHAVGHGLELPDYKGVPARRYVAWVERLGRPGRGPTVMRSFRLKPKDLERLRVLKEQLGASSETEVLRRALIALERTTEAETRR